MEGTSGHPEPLVFTEQQRRWPRRSPLSSDPRALPYRSSGRGQHVRRCVSAKSEELATGVSEVSFRRAPRVEQARARDRLPRGRRHEVPRSRWEAEAVSGVVKTPGPSVMPRDDHGSSWASRITKVVRGAENERRAGHRLGSDGRSRSDASCVLPAGRSQGLVGVRDASPEEAPSSPDAEQGRREGERVRDQIES